MRPLESFDGEPQPSDQCMTFLIQRCLLGKRGPDIAKRLFEGLPRLVVKRRRFAELALQLGNGRAELFWLHLALVIEGNEAAGFPAVAIQPSD